MDEVRNELLSYIIEKGYDVIKTEDIKNRYNTVRNIKNKTEVYFQVNSPSSKWKEYFTSIGLDEYLDFSTMSKFESKKERYNIFMYLKEEIPYQFLIDILFKLNILCNYTLKEGMILYSSNVYNFIYKITDKKIYYINIDTEYNTIKLLNFNKIDRFVYNQKLIKTNPSMRKIIKNFLG